MGDNLQAREHRGCDIVSKRLGTPYRAGRSTHGLIIQNLAAGPDGRLTLPAALRLITRNGYDFTDQYPLIVDVVRSLPAKSWIVDGEGIVVDQDGLSVFDLIRCRRHDSAATICAFYLIEVDGKDLLRSSIEERKDPLAALLGQRHPGIALNETYSGDGTLICQHACALGCEGIVSERLGSANRMGRTDAWIQIKNPDAPAVEREREIDWAKR
jgi:bifunctional non-homologous end joining protein LigD